MSDRRNTAGAQRAARHAVDRSALVAWGVPMGLLWSALAGFGVLAGVAGSVGVVIGVGLVVVILPNALATLRDRHPPLPNVPGVALSRDVAPDFWQLADAAAAGLGTTVPLELRLTAGTEIDAYRQSGELVVTPQSRSFAV